MRRDRNQPPSPPPAPTRALAAMLALLVFGLHLLASAPAAHAWLHRDVSHANACATSGEHSAPATSEKNASTPAAHHDATCAVSLFAQGLTAAPHLTDIAAPRVFVTLAPSLAFTREPAAAPARLHPPAHAPPSAT